jgi:hypothetical protein
MAIFFAWLPWTMYYLLFTVPALFFLRQRVMEDTARAVWALAIVSVPIMGVVAFAVIQPGQRAP